MGSCQLADIALEEAPKAHHKQTDTIHIFTILRLFSLAWTCLFHKLCEFIVKLPVVSSHWPSRLHEPLPMGVTLPFIRYPPWSLRGMPLLVDMDRRLGKVLGTRPVREMDGIFCANFCHFRGGFPAWRKMWHTGCCRCLGQEKFPMFQLTDRGGNVWYNQQKEEDRLNYG